MKQEDSEAIEFKAGKSSAAVTVQTQIKKVGDCVLIDTAGSNDPNKIRPDDFILFEIINQIRNRLSKEGINTFT